MSEVNDREAIEQAIKHMTEEFIVEDCAGDPTDGCLSCEMIRARDSLRKVLAIMDEDWVFTIDQLDSHSRDGGS